MIKIAALDDEKQWIITEEKITEQCFPAGEYEFLGYTSAHEFLLSLKNIESDIYLLDMEFQETVGLTGLDIGKEIKDLYEKSVIIYITGHVEYAIEAFEVNAFRYIPKVMLEKKLPEAYQAIAHIISRRKEEYFTIEMENRIAQVAKSQIYYFYKEKKYVIIVHSEGECKVRSSLEEIQKRMNQECFLRIDKGCVVNITHVMSLEHYLVKMRNGVYLTVSHPQIKNAKQKITEYWGQRY